MKLNHCILTADFLGVSPGDVYQAFSIWWKSPLYTRGFYNITFTECDWGTQARYVGEPHIKGRENFEVACKAALNLLSHTKGAKPSVVEYGNGVSREFFDFSRNNF